MFAFGTFSEAVVGLLRVGTAKSGNGKEEI